jgi:CRISPR-associated protein (TIGR03986 family)
MIKGELVVVGKKKILQVKFTNRKGNEVTLPIAEAELSQELTQRKSTAIGELNGLIVDLEEEKGQARQVREQGKPWQAPSKLSSSGNRATPQNRRSVTEPSRAGTSSVPGDFHNPYNFIPAIPRGHLSADHPLGDSTPVGHGIYHPDRWSGTIAVELTTMTPLLIPDAAKAEGINDEHKIYPIRVGPDGRPYLPPTSIKGMLRAAYEAITNSRLSIFEKHSDRLFYRMTAADGLSLIPAMVQGNRIKLMPGTTQAIPSWNGRRWEVPIMYAAWVSRYRGQRVGYPNMKHGDHVKVWLEQYQKLDRNGNLIFKYWKVREIVPASQNFPAKPEPSQGSNNHRPVPGEELIPVEGYLCITGRNIERKHDERVFFTLDNNPINHEEDCTSLSPDWEYLIKNYQEIHRDEQREEGYEWSRHVTGGTKETRLSTGADERLTLCYAFVERSGRNLQIRSLYPVMISRAIFDKSPEELLPTELHPAQTMKELSPADRVFGWVNQTGKGAYKGQLRISSVRCRTDNAIEDLTQHQAWRSTQGMPLAILGEPKPQQVRFYTAQDSKGKALKAGIPKSAGYQDAAQGLRGRKVYPHHQLPENYWDPTSNDLAVGDRYREYFHPGQVQTTQNRTIKAWVKPQISFSFKIHVANLSSVELGALLWLLNLSKAYPNHYHRLGGGKPLGFGSIKLNIVETETTVCTGEQWRTYYQSLLSQSEPGLPNIQHLIQTFESALETAYQSKRPPFIQAFLKAAQGFEKPIHTPRTTAKPSADVESFKWFVENEKEGRNGGLKLALPELINDQGLPLSPNNQASF